ncbi:calcium/sodium antiporter [Candidatus Shapirobacteria bacterium]|nr:calcium/sodium antiporter [Candidatus Shapirobacteria bacterium]
MITLVIIITSLLFLVKSADVFVDQASAFAKKLKISDFLIGFTVVAFGTSLPELISTIFSALAGHNQLVVSNIIGSNITNSCLIFGLIAIFNNFKIRKRDVDINIPLNMAALMAFWALAVFMGFTLNWSAGISLILVFFVLLVLSKEYNHIKIAKLNMTQFSPLVLILSLTFLVISGKICIEQIINLANQLKVSETILGYFLLAVGTSLPELVTTWVAVKKNDGELAVGNILGSNLFNLLFIFGISTFIRPIQLVGFRTDLVFLTGITLATYSFAITGKKYSFNKKEGLGLLSLYVLFVVFQIFGT